MTFRKKLENWLGRVWQRHPRASDPRHKLGLRGEAAAEKYLKRQGYKILGRRLRTRLGELDLVAVDGRTIVFVEVKTWHKPSGFDHPADAVTAQKQRQITRAATAFLKSRGLLEYAGRFDIVAITWPEDSRRPKIEHIKNAFEAVGRGEFFS
jgi:putative endonuclease